MLQPDWKSRAADTLRRIGQPNHARALYGIGGEKDDKAPRPSPRAPKPRPTTFLGKLRRWLLPSW